MPCTDRGANETARVRQHSGQCDLGLAVRCRGATADAARRDARQLFIKGVAIK